MMQAQSYYFGTKILHRVFADDVDPILLGSTPSHTPPHPAQSRYIVELLTHHYIRVTELTCSKHRAAIPEKFERFKPRYETPKLGRSCCLPTASTPQELNMEISMSSLSATLNSLGEKVIQVKETCSNDLKESERLVSARLKTAHSAQQMAYDEVSRAFHVVCSRRVLIMDEHGFFIACTWVSRSNLTFKFQIESMNPVQSTSIFINNGSQLLGSYVILVVVGCCAVLFRRINVSR